MHVLRSGYERYLVGIKSLKTTILIIPLVKDIDMITVEVNIIHKAAIMAVASVSLTHTGEL